MRAIGTYEWLPGEFFLLNRMDAVMAATVDASARASRRGAQGHRDRLGLLAFEYPARECR
jgi:hypothetical protein